MNGPTFAQPIVPLTVAPGSPRPAGPRPPARMAAPARPDEAGNPARVLTYLKLHWLMILFCGTLLGAGLAYAAWSLLPSKYESYALLQVASTPSSIAAQNDPTRGRTDFVTYMKTSAQLIKSEFVLNSALNDTRYKIAELPTLKDQKDPIKYLDEKLVVTYSEGSEILRVSLEGDRPDDIRKVVDAVKDAYYREVVEKEVNQKTALRRKVEEARTKLEEVIKTKVVSHQGAAGARPVAIGVAADAPIPGAVAIPAPAPAAAPKPAEPEPMTQARASRAMNKVFALESQLEQFPLLLAEKAFDVEAVRKQIDGLKAGPPPSAEVYAMVDRDPEVMAKEFEVRRLRDDHKYLAKVTVNPNGERVVRMKERADEADAALKKLRDERALRIETGKRQEESGRLVPVLRRAERELGALRDREQMVRRMLDETRKEVADIPAELRKDELRKPLVETSVTELGTYDGVYAALTKQQIGLDMELQSPPRVRKLQEASAPSQKDIKKQVMATVFAGLLGFGLIGLGVIAAESKAQKLSSLADLKSTGQTPVVGVIPWRPDGGPATDPIAQADVTEGVDRLRSYVSQTWLARGATTVAVTSPVGDEGKGFAAFALGTSLAAAGYKTLLVDFDLRTPALHAFAGVGNEVGVCDLLRGQSDPRSAVVGLDSGLWLLPAGKWGDDVRAAAVGARLDALLTRLKEPFDCVILHGHALLTAAEAVEIARRSDVVLLCTLYRDTRLPLLKRAADRVAAMEVPYSGVVYLGATPQEALC